VDPEREGMSTSEMDVAYGGVPAGKENIYSQQPVLSARKLVITFGRVVGLDGVDMDLYPGEILAVIGDNGAGKSTLIKCLTGAYIPDSGTITMNGQPVAFRKPQDARAAGIETVYQQLAVIPALTSRAISTSLARTVAPGRWARCCGCWTRRAWSGGPVRPSRASASRRSRT